MTAFVVGARSGDPERARFIRALIASLLLHALIFAMKVGPAPGSRTHAVPGGGTIEAVLRRAPAAGSLPDQILDAGVQPALVALNPEALKLPKAVDAATRPAVATALPVTAAAVPGLRDDGRDALPGGAASGSESMAIPLLPPPAMAREVPGRPSLLAPLNFSYPPNIRVQGGRVRVRILLDEKGQVEEMRTEAAVPPGFFDQAAMQVLRSARFAPGFVGPSAVRSYLYMELTFGPGPQGQQVRYAGSAFAPIPVKASPAATPAAH